MIPATPVSRDCRLSPQFSRVPRSACALFGTTMDGLTGAALHPRGIARWLPACSSLTPGRALPVAGLGHVTLLPPAATGVAACGAGIGAEERGRGDRVIYCPIALLPPGHDPGADGGLASPGLPVRVYSGVLPRQLCQPKASCNRGEQHLTGPVCYFTSGLAPL